jgi:DNA polymerase I-like protein with 3'-5' exonuclease and polymerase domains
LKKNTNYGVLDVESTIFAKGSPFADRNKLCLVGLRIEDTNHVFKIEYDEAPYGDELSRLVRLMASLDCIVGFNIKFDLNWLARYGIFLPVATRVFDCQLAEFILDHQRSPYPSLDGCLLKYNLGEKDHVVDREYWSKGIDTDKVPLPILTHYLETDLEKTDALYLTLLPLVGRYEALLNLHMQDLRVLQEMEYNGQAFDFAGMQQAAEEVEKELDGCHRTILSGVPEGFRQHFNSSSGDHLSALLYGGTIRVDVGTPYQHTYKSGPQAGTTCERYKWREECLVLPRLAEPPEGSELKKEGFYSVDEETLLQLKKPKDLVAALLRRAELEKLLGTYYRGIPDLMRKVRLERRQSTWDL